MIREDALATRPARGATIRTIVLLALAFLAGLGVMAGIAHYRGRLFDGAGTDRLRAGDVAHAAQPNVPPGTDLAALYAREITLAQRIDQLEARLGGIDTESRAAASQAGRAEGLLVAFAARRALDRGLPLGYVEAQLNDRFGTVAPVAVTTIVQAAREPVTLEDLRVALDTIAPHLVSGGPRDSIWTRLRRQLNTIVVIRQESSPSPRPGDRLERARRMLDAGNAEAAMAEVSRLPGAEHGTSWIDAATRYVEARRALNTIELAAIQGRSTLPVPAAPVVPPAITAP